jgi:uncharacterized OB-fold protein
MADDLESPFIVDGWMGDSPGGRMHLKGVRCTRCGTCAWPPSAHCKACGSAEFTPVELGPDAELYSWTIDRMGTFLGRPNLVGQVRFPEGTFVQGFIDADVEHPPAVGAAIELVPFPVESGGDHLLTYAFKLKES